MDYHFAGLNRLGVDLVKGLSLVEDPSHIYPIGGKVFNLKKWRGSGVTVFEEVFINHNDGQTLTILSCLTFMENGVRKQAAQWICNPKLNKTYDIDSCQYNF